MMKLGYSNFKHHDKPRSFWMDDLKKGDAIMSGVMHRAGELTLHYLVQYDGYRHLTIYVRRGEYVGEYRYSYDVMPTHLELLQAITDIENDMLIFF